jgi:hypothetical protein
MFIAYHFKQAKVALHKSTQRGERVGPVERNTAPIRAGGCVAVQLEPKTRQLCTHLVEQFTRRFKRMWRMPENVSAVLNQQLLTSRHLAGVGFIHTQPWAWHRLNTGQGARVTHVFGQGIVQDHAHVIAHFRDLRKGAKTTPTAVAFRLAAVSGRGSC